MKFIDMHCDTISSIYLDRMGREVKKLRENNGHVDLARLKKGGCLAQNFALFTILKKDPDPCGFARGACRLKNVRRAYDRRGRNLQRQYGRASGFLPRRRQNDDFDLEL